MNLQKRGSKKGLSTIVITLIIILVSLVAVGIVWVIVRNIIQGGAEDANLSQFSLNAKILDVHVDDISNNVSLLVKRNAGQGNMTAINFVFSSSAGTEVLTRNVPLKEMEQMSFTFNLNTSVSDLISLSIVPSINEKGKQILGIELDKYNFGASENNLPPCIPNSDCVALNYECGTNWADGCSGNFNCEPPDCISRYGAGYICNLNGRCASTCTPSLSCVALGYQCGTPSNGTCSGNLDCGPVNCLSYGIGYTCNSTYRCVDTTSPTRASGAPSGILAAGTTQTTISLSTNENAICRYSTSAGTSYASMASTFTTTGGTSHSRIIAGLVNGQSYNYYVRCNDSAGNFNINDYRINFSVASASCTPNCAGRECGSDGCSGTCPPGCGGGYNCNASYRCEVSTGAIIIDHTSLNIYNIPVSAILNAKSRLNVSYGHTSHGQQIINGMDKLDAFMTGRGYPSGTFAVDFDNTANSTEMSLWDVPWSTWYPWNPTKLGWAEWGRDLGSKANSDGSMTDGDYTAWVYTTRKFLGWIPGSGDGTHLSDYATGTPSYNAAGCHNTNVIIWSWCGQASYASDQAIYNYLYNMSKLEQDYPQVKFVYMTGHLDSTGLTGTLHRHNEIIRNFTRVNNKILYDFEDIESYDIDGNYYGDKHVTDASNYDFNGNGITSELDEGANNWWPKTPLNGDRNWALDWQNSHTLNVDWYNTTTQYYHAQALNVNMKAYATWNLFARLAGWGG